MYSSRQLNGLIFQIYQIVKFIKFVKDNDLMLGEYRQKSNWGSWKEKPVIIDAGVTRTNQELTL